MAPAADDQSIPLSYQFSQADYLALTAAMNRSPIQQILRVLPIWLGTVVVLLIVLASKADDFATGLFDLVALRAKPPIIYPIMTFGLALTLLTPVFTRLTARRLYKTLSMASQRITGKLDATGAHTAMQGIQSHLDWVIVQRAIVTDEHLFLVFSRREALVIPKRAFENHQALDKAMALISSRVPAQ